MRIQSISPLTRRKTAMVSEKNAKKKKTLIEIKAWAFPFCSNSLSSL